LVHFSLWGRFQVGLGAGHLRGFLTGGKPVNNRRSNPPFFWARGTLGKGLWFKAFECPMEKKRAYWEGIVEISTPKG